MIHVYIYIPQKLYLNGILISDIDEAVIWRSEIKLHYSIYIPIFTVSQLVNGGLISLGRCMSRGLNIWTMTACRNLI